MSDARIEPFKGVVECGPPPDPALLRDIQRICEQVAKREKGNDFAHHSAHWHSFHNSCHHYALSIVVPLPSGQSCVTKDQTWEKNKRLTLYELVYLQQSGRVRQ